MERRKITRVPADTDIQPMRRSMRPVDDSSAPGAATKKATKKLDKEIRNRAAATGLLPHEILLSFARGEQQEERHIDIATGEVKVIPYMPTKQDRIDCAKAAAPYFAPKLGAMKLLDGATDDDLDSLITQLAAEAGVSVGAGGAGETEEDEGGQGGTE